jgi:hypothetical protein
LTIVTTGCAALALLDCCCFAVDAAACWQGWSPGFGAHFPIHTGVVIAIAWKKIQLLIRNTIKKIQRYNQDTIKIILRFLRTGGARTVKLHANSANTAFLAGREISVATRSRRGKG